jgi:hypothetical protein
MTKSRQRRLIRWTLIAAAASFESLPVLALSFPVSDSISLPLGCGKDCSLRILDVCRLQKGSLNGYAAVPMPVEKAACLGDRGKVKILVF